MKTRFEIIVDTENKNVKDKRTYDIADPIHNVLAGNKAYVDCDIVLNFEDNVKTMNDHTGEEEDIKKVTLYVDLDQLTDKEKDVVKNALEIINNYLFSKEGE